MPQHGFERAVARATGESVRLIRALGFSLADPPSVLYDPEPPRRPLLVDWDARQANQPGCSKQGLALR